jgi:ADP-heptose:LPS heptosyltransferase
VKPSFLIVRFSAIGDSVIAAHAATSIRLAHPDANIVWAAEPVSMPVIDTSTLVNEVAEIPRVRRRGVKVVLRWHDYLPRFLRLRKYRFDYGVDFQGHLKTALCLRISGAKHRVAAYGVDGVARVMSPIPGPHPADMHTVEWNHHVLECAWGLGNGAGLAPIQGGHFPRVSTPTLPDLSEERAKIMFMRSSQKPLATISVGAGHPRKYYPASQWAEVASSLLELGYQVAFLGRHSDPRVEYPGAEDWIGKLELREAMAAVAESSVHLAADTGSGHMAAALGVPSVSVFGPTKPEWFRPYTSNGIVLREGVAAGAVSPGAVVQAVLDLTQDRRDAAVSS